MRILIAVVGLSVPASEAWAQSAGEVPADDAVVVTATREREKLVDTPASIGVISGDTVARDRPSHPSQIVSQIPGVAVAVTNGEGHTTSIRQPFTTGPVYLFLEDGVPIRSTGFFNHNALYEVNVPQAGGIEVTRGPGSALYGSDAIGGVINVLTRRPPDPGQSEVSAFGEVGSFGWNRLLIGGGTSDQRDGWRGDLNLTSSAGWRDSTGYDRRSGTFRWDHDSGGDSRLKTVLAFSDVYQQTGANSPLVESDYRNNPTKNYLPIAYRAVTAVRLSSAYEQGFGSDGLLSLTPYVRDDSMDLLASYNLNSDPTLATTANRSFGLQAKWRQDFAPMRARLIAGADLDVSPGGRLESAIRTTTAGTGASREHLAYTEAGRIYDYDVTYSGISPYLHGEISPSERLRITAGLRYDHLSYDFSNRVSGPVTIPAVGGTFPTGVRVYGQSASTTVSFDHVSPKLGATYAFAPATHAFASYTHGFRAPSEGDLFRPSFGTSAAAAQAAADAALHLKPIKADQLEAGLRGKVREANYDVAVYHLRKRDDIVTQRDTATNFTQRVNAGETLHRGVEVGAGVPLARQWRADAAFTATSQTYVSFVTSNGDFSGKHIEAAPRNMGNVRLTWTPAASARLQLEWVHIGEYWLDAANTAKYPGHDLLNLRANLDVSKKLGLYGSIYNLANKRYADSAQISSSTPVFSPGLPFTVYAGVEVRL